MIVERELRERRIEREREVQVREMGGDRVRGTGSGVLGSACTDAYQTPLAMREAWEQQVIAVRAHIHRELNEAS